MNKVYFIEHSEILLNQSSGAQTSVCTFDQTVCEAKFNLSFLNPGSIGSDLMITLCSSSAPRALIALAFSKYFVHNSVSFSASFRKDLGNFNLISKS